MHVSELRIVGIKCFQDTTSIALQRNLNVFVGQNNSGKSTVISSLCGLQYALLSSPEDLRINTDKGHVRYLIENLGERYTHLVEAGESVNEIRYNLNPGNAPQLVTRMNNGGMRGIPFFSAKEPKNFIYPHLSKRKVTGFSEQINEDNSTNVLPNLANIYSKIDRLMNPNVAEHEEYKKACQSILGLQISTRASPQGKKAELSIGTFNGISVEKMGDGSAHLLGMIADLCVANNNLFLIEEPETDIHPKALKNLLNFIIEKSRTNQFIISTHSNIVVKYLGAAGAAVFEVKMGIENKIPTSSIEPISNNPNDRQKLLENLGYEFFDTELWDAWLILEESSAEKIIRSYLVPWFAPKLVGRMRTFSARTRSEVESKFSELNKLFVFVHLTPVYKNRCWVLIDGGKDEAEVISRMRTLYGSSGWRPEQFLNLSEHDFEKYYPSSFSEKFKEITQGPKDDKKIRKKELLDEVVMWIDEDIGRAKTEFAESAREVINILTTIERSLSRE